VSPFRAPRTTVFRNPGRRRANELSGLAPKSRPGGPIGWNGDIQSQGVTCFLNTEKDRSLTFPFLYGLFLTPLDFPFPKRPRSPRGRGMIKALKANGSQAFPSDRRRLSPSFSDERPYISLASSKLLLVLYSLFVPCSRRIVRSSLLLLRFPFFLKLPR